MREFWEKLNRRRRTGLLVGATAIVLAVGAVGVMLLMPQREVLFNALAPQDAAAMTAELEKMKVPYQVSEDGQSILVDKANVHKLRMKLMTRDIPLHGAVGFELFNNNDFGMTEFAQKVNYQRALQGEITRTVLSLEEIESARVHLVFAEDGLLKRNPQRAKASVTVGVRHGRTLKSDQVFGVQRLVAAAVPGIAVDDVTVLSNRGVVLSRASDEAGGEGAGPRAELQQDVERQLNRKVAELLTKAYGAEQFVSNVSVTLDMDQVKVTSEEVLGANAAGEVPQGLVLRERESLTETPTSGGSREGAQIHGRSSRDTEYQLGRRVEQVVKRPGAVARIQVLAVVRQRLDAAHLERLRAAISASVGAIAERGDVITVQSLDMLGGAGIAGSAVAAEISPATLGDAETLGRSGGKPVADPASRDRAGWPDSQRTVMWVLVGLLVLIGALLVGRLTARRTVDRRLSVAERERVLGQLRQWTAGGAQASADAGARHADGMVR
ncbi:flagellar M-ring protein FliF [Roseateles sp. DAIF2]|uniref:flagellar basal-body MS-ring/collar protein FliF n=1 Tax=Roseateles sp. DAIF2 TaxID=2714952 RepID=UPI0018A24EEA|nr:flagellar basal-body MS-ring/collar protein FliF [Roseateles sp. DAIF2]QPF74678.1 flagellar M-ring protein FliF [Roseateles sp. DAIF2]